jgi:hypothetical protein
MNYASEGKKIYIYSLLNIMSYLFALVLEGWGDFLKCVKAEKHIKVWEPLA